MMFKRKYDGYANSLKNGGGGGGRLQVKDCQRYTVAPVHAPSCDVRLYIIIAGCAILI